MKYTGNCSSINCTIKTNEKLRLARVRLSEPKFCCDFIIKDGVICRFSLSGEPSDYKLLASAIGVSINRCGYKKVKIGRNLIRTDWHWTEHKKLAEALKKTKVGKVKEYGFSYYADIYKQQKYLKGTIKAISGNV